MTKTDQDSLQPDPASKHTPTIRLILIKIGVFLLIVSIYVAGFIVAYQNFVRPKNSSNSNEMLLQYPLKIVNWRDIGRVSDPVLELPIKTTNGWKKIEFLLDTGAVISSLPREIAKEMGQNLAFLKRVTFIGYGDTESFSYKGKMTVRLGEEEVELPVVFTEGYGTRALLGRQGFFDKYVIVFNKKKGIIEVRK
jgi:hypothetical protein